MNDYKLTIAVLHENATENLNQNQKAHDRNAQTNQLGTAVTQKGFSILTNRARNRWNHGGRSFIDLGMFLEQSRRTKEANKETGVWVSKSTKLGQNRISAGRKIPYCVPMTNEWTNEWTNESTATFLSYLPNHVGANNAAAHVFHARSSCVFFL